MAGLETIALAVAHLERMQDSEDREEGNDENEAATKLDEPRREIIEETEAPSSAHLRPFLPPASGSVLPTRCGFGHEPRLVSGDYPMAAAPMGYGLPVGRGHHPNPHPPVASPPHGHLIAYHHAYSTPATEHAKRHHQAVALANSHSPHSPHHAHRHLSLGPPHPQLNPKAPAASPSVDRSSPYYETSSPVSEIPGRAGLTNEAASPVAVADASMRALERRIMGASEETDTMCPIPPVPPLSEVITRVQENDVLCGRGGETNHHSGNIQYRQFVKACQPAYIAAKRRDKPRIAERIVLTVRKLGGRFLKKDSETNTWRDVGNTKAREKTSQALREGAPDLRSTPGGTGAPPDHGSNGNVTGINAEAGLAPAILSLNHSGSFPKFDKPYEGMRLLHQQQQQITPSSSNSSSKRRRISLCDGTSSGTRASPWQWALPAGDARGPASLHQVDEGKSSLSGQVPSPKGCAASVSADDDEGSQGSGHSSSDRRGPRIKLLKRRLEQ